MTYITTTSSISGDREAFGQISDRVEAHADGLIARYAGMNDQGLVITTVWESKAQSDRFVAEHLVPTVRELFGERPTTGVTVDFEAFDEFQTESSS